MVNYQSSIFNYQLPQAYGDWSQQYKISDHLGSVRAVLKEDDGSYVIVNQNDYKPFGEILENSGNQDRTSYIGKEKDAESQLGDYGVRKYDDGLGPLHEY